jgi:hypothetical protein
MQSARQRRAERLPSSAMNTNFFNKRLAHLLGFASLVPFVLLTLICWGVHPDWLGRFIRGQLAYGITILSFMGGMHWGAALLSPQLTSEQSKKALIWGVMPAVIAWAALLHEMGLGFAVLMIGFIGAYRIDKHLYAWYRMPEWLIELRFKLTCVVVAALALTFIAANVRS